MGRVCAVVISMHGLRGEPVGGRPCPPTLSKHRAPPMADGIALRDCPACAHVTEQRVLYYVNGCNILRGRTCERRDDSSSRFHLLGCGAPLSRNQVRNFRYTLDLESVNCLLQHAVSIGDPFVLAQMFEPGFHEKGLDHPAYIGGILEHAPGVSAIAPALTCELFKRRQERLAIF